MRDIDVLPGKEAAALKFAGSPAGNLVFASVPSHMDVHSCRREYANALYHSYQEKPRKTEGRNSHNFPPIWGLRPVRNSDVSRVREWRPVSSYYRGRKDRWGVTYDKKAMLYVS